MGSLSPYPPPPPNLTGVAYPRLHDLSNRFSVSVAPQHFGRYSFWHSEYILPTLLVSSLPSPPNLATDLTGVAYPRLHNLSAHYSQIHQEFGRYSFWHSSHIVPTLLMSSQPSPPYLTGVAYPKLHNLSSLPFSAPGRGVISNYTTCLAGAIKVGRLRDTECPLQD